MNKNRIEIIQTIIGLVSVIVIFVFFANQAMQVRALDQAVDVHNRSINQLHTQFAEHEPRYALGIDCYRIYPNKILGDNNKRKIFQTCETEVEIGRVVEQILDHLDLMIEIAPGNMDHFELQEYPSAWTAETMGYWYSRGAQ